MDNVTSLVRVNYEGATTILSRINLADCESLEKLDLRSLNQLSNDTGGSLINLKGLKYFYLGALNNIDSGQLERILVRNIGRNPYFLYAGQTSGDMKVYYNTSWGVQNQQAFTRCNAGWQIGDTCTINGLTYTAVDGTPTADGEFNCAADQDNNQRQANFTTAINNDTRTGTVGDLAAVNDSANMYIYCTTSGSAGNAITAVMGGSNTGTATFDWSPFQYGNDIYQALVDMRDIEGATMTEVDNIITVNAPTGLSATSISLTSFTLNFTEPSANANGTETYEVWVEETNNKANPKNYFYYQYVSGTGIRITELEPNTEYTVKVRTQDSQMQFSDFSSSISVTTIDSPDWSLVTGAYSFELLDSDNLGVLQNEVIELRRSSDNAVEVFEWDINNKISLSSENVSGTTNLGAWAGSDDVYIVSFQAQRQTGNSWNVAYELGQSTNTAQPQLLNAGALITDENGKVAMEFTSANSTSINTFSAAYNIGNNVGSGTAMIVASQSTTGSVDGVYSTRFNNTRRFNLYIDTTNSTTEFAQAGTDATNTQINLLSSTNDGSAKVMTLEVNNSTFDMAAYLGAEEQGTANFGSAVSSGKVFFGYNENGTQHLDGKISCALFFESILTEEQRIRFQEYLINYFTNQ